jgi:hypothetical protein
MAKVIKEIYVRTEAGVSSEARPIGAKAKNVTFTDNESLEIKNNKINEEISNLHIKDTELQNEIDDLKAEDIKINNKISDLQKKDASLEETINSNKKITEEADSQLQININNVQTNLDNVKQELEDVDKAVNNSVDDTNAAIETLDGECSIQTAEVEGINIYIEDSAQMPMQKFEISLNEGQIGIPTPDNPIDIPMLTSNSSIEFKSTDKNGNNETSLNIQIPDDKFVGYINDDVKDIIRIIYNEEDARYHLYLDKVLGKDEQNNVSNVIIDDMKSNGAFNSYVGGTLNNKTITFDREVGKSIVIYELAESYIVDLGVVDMPLTQNPITNAYIISDLEMKIDMVYYKNTRIMEPLDQVVTMILDRLKRYNVDIKEEIG